MPISRSHLSSLSMSDVLRHLTENDQQSQMKSYIENNGIRLDRLRKLGDYCATLIYERDPNVTIPQPITENKKVKSTKKKNVS